MEANSRINVIVSSLQTVFSKFSGCMLSVQRLADCFLLGLQEFWLKMGAMGLLGVTASPEYGGAGMSYLDHIVVSEEMSRVSAAIALSYGAHSNLCVNQINLNGTVEQKEKYLPKVHLATKQHSMK